MRALIIFGAMAVFGAAGWWVGESVGIMTAFIVSTILSGLGLYLGRRFVDEYLP